MKSFFQSLVSNKMRMLTGVLALASVVTGVALVRELAASDCCSMGASCCKPGASCCHRGGASHAAR